MLYQPTIKCPYSKFRAAFLKLYDYIKAPAKIYLNPKKNSEKSNIIYKTKSQQF